MDTKEPTGTPNTSGMENLFDTISQTTDELGKAYEEIARLKAWVNDLQSGMYINCVYCGHRYGPGEATPVSMADALKAHIEECPQHPASKVKNQIVIIQELAEPFRYALQQLADKDWHDDYTVFVNGALWDETGLSITAKHFYKLMSAIFGEFPKIKPADAE